VRRKVSPTDALDYGKNAFKNESGRASSGIRKFDLFSVVLDFVLLAIFSQRCFQALRISRKLLFSPIN
jgi:hypothetical protein